MFQRQNFSHFYVINFLLRMLKVRQFQNEFVKSSFLPKCEQKIVRISALTTQGRNPDNFLFVFHEKRWLHKFILKLSDLWVALPHNVAKFLNCCLFFDGSALPFLSFFQFFQNDQFLFKCPISKIWTFLIFQTSYLDPPWPSELFIILMKNQMQNSSTSLKKLSPPCFPHCA